MATSEALGLSRPSRHLDRWVACPGNDSASNLLPINVLEWDECHRASKAAFTALRASSESPRANIGLKLREVPHSAIGDRTPLPRQHVEAPAIQAVARRWRRVYSLRSMAGSPKGSPHL